MPRKFILILLCQFTTLLSTVASSAPPSDLKARFEIKAKEVMLFPPAGHHFNLKAPNEGPEGIRPNKNSKESVLIYGSATGGNYVSYLCDDKKTYCVRTEAALLRDATLQVKGFDPKSLDRMNQGHERPVPKGFLRYQGSLPDNASQRLLVFSADWCPPCQQYHEEVWIHPDFQRHLSNVAKVYVNVDDPISFRLKSDFEIGGYPTIILQTKTKHGDWVTTHQVIGFFPWEVLKNFLSQKDDSGKVRILSEDADPESARIATLWEKLEQSKERSDPVLRQEILKILEDHYQKLMGKNLKRSAAFELAGVYLEQARFQDVIILMNQIEKLPESQDFTPAYLKMKSYLAQKKKELFWSEYERAYERAKGDQKLRVSRLAVQGMQAFSMSEVVLGQIKALVQEFQKVDPHLKVRSFRYFDQLIGELNRLDANLIQGWGIKIPKTPLSSEKNHLEKKNIMENLFQFLKSLHQPETYQMWLATGGVAAITAIVFAETGLLMGFFLPGDSLLITAGVLSQPENPNHVMGLSVWQLSLFLTLAAILGNQLGYFLGSKAGPLIFSRKDGLLFKKKHLQKAQDFYEKHGVRAIILARFIPILRTFVPFVAGVAKMPYSRFLKWDLFGGAFWINSLLFIGYKLGATEMANRLDKLIVIVIFVSFLPVIIGGIKNAVQK